MDEAVAQSKQIVRVDAGGAHIIAANRGAIRRRVYRRANVRVAVKGKPAVYVKVEKLIELLVTEVPTELKTVIADNLAVVIAELESVTDLRQLPAGVIAD
ncbi:MAG: hypothetical protein E6L07_15810 [Verrucomicrobia bacterium]|nr:MAG: hypothetical protein E6L07_15810 [Verrucomicrobiota bacterium]